MAAWNNVFLLVVTVFGRFFWEKVNTASLSSVKFEEFALDKVLRQIKQLFTCLIHAVGFWCFFLSPTMQAFVYFSLHIKLIRILGSNYFLLQHPFSAVAQ